MKQDSDDIPVACRLSAAELRNREATLLAKFRSAVSQTEELPQGYAFRLSSDPESVALIAELILAERQCCLFLTFEMIAAPYMGPVSVRVTGPAGTKMFVKQILCDPEDSP
ncbi:MAG TPA: hypothetical protein VFA89_08300 [Terriglobales bacterium]|nr:hypothetical protein [Terriglobales bacterium]